MIHLTECFQLHTCDATTKNFVFALSSFLAERPSLPFVILRETISSAKKINTENPGLVEISWFRNEMTRWTRSSPKFRKTWWLIFFSIFMFSPLQWPNSLHDLLTDFVQLSDTTPKVWVEWNCQDSFWISLGQWWSASLRIHFFDRFSWLFSHCGSSLCKCMSWFVWPRFPPWARRCYSVPVVRKHCLQSNYFSSESLIFGYTRIRFSSFAFSSWICAGKSQICL